MQFNFDFHNNGLGSTTSIKNGSDVHNHEKNPKECGHVHLDFCSDCNQFYCLDCVEPHYKLRHVFLDRFLVSDKCQSMDTLRDYLLEGNFIVQV